MTEQSKKRNLMARKKLKPRKRGREDVKLAKELHKWVDKYYRHIELQVKHGEASHHTLRAYKESLVKLMEYVERYVERDMTLDEIDEFLIEGYLSWATHYQVNIAKGAIEEVQEDIELFLRYAEKRKGVPIEEVKVEHLTALENEIKKMDDKEKEHKLHELSVIAENIEDFELWHYETGSKKEEKNVHYYILNYIAHRRKNMKPNAKATMRLRRASVGGLLHYIDKKNRFSYDFKTVMQLTPSYKSKKEEQVRFAFSVELVEALEKAFNDVPVLKGEVPDRTEFSKWRNSFMGMAMLFGGFRAAEALDLKPSDFEYLEDKNVYRVNIREGKGFKQRYTYIPRKRIAKLYDFMEEHLHLYGEYYSTTTRGNKMKYANLVSEVNKLYETHGIKELSGLHVLRHIFASMIAREGGAVLVKELLGHASLSTSEIYIDVSGEDACNVVIAAFEKMAA